jgi:hypothetical protein
MSALRAMRPGAKVFGLLLTAAMLAVFTLMLPSIQQPLEYHRFADQRMFLGLPNFFDTVSNTLFVLAGVAGLFFLRGSSARHVFIEPRESLPYSLFFVAIILVGFASGVYHLAPDNERLAWDRAAIALALMAWFSAILCERAGLVVGLRILPLLVVAGLGSVVYWGASEARGAGDLRFYGLMQCLPMLLIPLLLILYPSRYSNDRDIVIVIGLYVLALLFDVSDRLIFSLTGGLVSGHTAKHLVAALAAYWIMRHLKHRRIV